MKQHPPQALKEQCCFLETRLGWLKVCHNSQGIVEIRFVLAKRPGCEHGNASLPGTWMKSICLAASGRSFKCPPLQLKGTDFQKAVWAQIARIPAGQTRSYRDIATAIGRPRATRAVGTACGANPVPLLIPCHRVLRTDGSLGGFTGGISIKKDLLAVEKTAGH